MSLQAPLSPQSELWRKQYRQRRYLEHATAAGLEDRTRYTVENAYTLLESGKLGLRRPENGERDWVELFTHCHEEYRLRGESFPDGFLTGAKVPRATFPNPPPMVAALKKAGCPRPGTFLVRLGRKEHMRDLHEHGRLRISAASSYSDPSLNPAIRDNELEISTVSLKSEVRIQALDRQSGKPKGLIVPLGDVTRTRSSTSDYYVYCLSGVLDFRLFGDFGYDACVILTSPDAFVQRLFKAASAALPGWMGASEPVRYLDPYRSKDAQMDVYFSKHHRYWYQREYRFAWLPPKAKAPPLPPAFLELGDLSDISTLIVA
ncbi:MAG TPA: hypothetical protein VG889_03285 [Rhizomicrobium sp.]|nr:hypothetical protein [Rhizomicrobium sp.]